jgi:RND family efflux transporter MFP subunit
MSTVSGTLEPQARALLRAELPGAVRTLSVKVGERVSAGQTIATLEVPAVRSAMAAAEAHVAAQEVALRQAQRERERTQQLLTVGGVSRTEMDDWESRVQAAEAAVEAARAQRATAAADVARLVVRAPFTGIVEQRAATQGSIVQVGDELVRIIDPRTLELEAGVVVGQARRVRPGTRVALRVAGITDTAITARVVRVAPALDPVTRQLRITVLVPNVAGHIPAGAWAEGTLLADSTGGR